MLSKDETNINLLQRLNLPVITSLGDLSYSLLLSEQLLYFLSTNTERFYKSFSIPKRNGNIREIHSPKSSLRVVQCWILRNILEKIPLSETAMGFRKGTEYGIKNNAERHCQMIYVLRMDIENFFPTIRRKMVYPIFKELGYSQFISNVFTNYCMLNNFLPQGASTSPYISNIVFKKIDQSIIMLCDNADVIYTRYADDIILSCNNKSTLLETTTKITSIVQENGFQVNRKKTILMSPAQQKMVTGLIINSGQVKVKRKLRRNVRAMIYTELTKDGFLSNVTKGYLAFIKDIDLKRYENLIEYVNNLLKNKGISEVAYGTEKH